MFIIQFFQLFCMIENLQNEKKFFTNEYNLKIYIFVWSCDQKSGDERIGETWRAPSSTL